MKVLHTLDSLNRGGTETLVLDVCRNARRFRMDLTFVATGGGSLEKEFRDSGADFVRFERKMPLDPNLVLQLRKLIREREIDILHAHQPVEALHLYLASLGLGDTRCVLTHHGGALFLETRNRTAVKFLAPLMDANIACSRAMFPWLREKFGIDTSRNFFLVRNGVDERKLITDAHVTLREETGVVADGPLFGMIANFVSYGAKDQLTVCRALPEFFEQFPEAGFVFVGKVSEGAEEYFDKCVRFCDEKGIGEKVFFAGPREDIPEVLAALDAFVLSSHQEGLPIAAIEAMLAGVPLIVSDIPPLLELAENGKNAAVFQVGNERELAARMKGLAGDAEESRRMAGRAYEHALENYSIDAHLRGLRTLYLNLLDDDGPEAPEAEGVLVATPE